MGSTLMRLSYENDLQRLLSGARETLYESILAESGLTEDDGELYVDVPADHLPTGLFRLGQGLTRVEGMGLWTRSRVQSTFTEDLRDLLFSLVPQGEIQRNYIVPGLEQAENYPIDYRITTPHKPLFLFGVSGKDRAMLTTIILQHLQKHRVSFDSMVVFEDFDELSKREQRHLMNAANDMVASIKDVEAIKQKIDHRRAA